MALRMLTRKLVRDLWYARGQVVTIALVVAAGIAAFSASLSTYTSLKSMRDAYYAQARFAHVFASARRVPNALAPRLLEIPGVSEAEAGLSYDAMLALPGVLEPMVARLIALPDRRSAAGDATGAARDEAPRPALNRLALMSGRWIDPARGDEVLVNASFAGKRGLHPGDTVQVLMNGRLATLRIAGTVLSPEYIFAAAHGVGDERGFGVFWIGRERLAAAFAMDGAFNRVALRLAHGASERAAIDALDRLLAPYGGIGAVGRADHPSDRAVSQEINEQRVFGLVLPTIFLGVAVFLLNVVLARQIGTQRGQIAALKALGCADGRIGAHYLAFTLAIVALGIVLGVAAGAVLGRMLTGLYAEFFHFPSLDYAMPAWIPLTASAAALAGAAGGALQSALAVMRLAPAEAMRPPAPTTFRATVLERLGFTRVYSPAVRMVLRDMERRPLRTLATSLGIAGAVAILISGTWWGDAIDYLLEVELRLRERQDVGVQLVEVAPSTVAYDLARLPGVVRAEPDRTVPVRLVRGTRAVRTSVTGLMPDASIRVLMDEALRAVPLPPEGLVVNATLAEQLGARRGDAVQVEFLLGRRAVREVPIVAMVGDLMGTPAFMDLRALNRLVGDGDAAGGARVVLDAARRADFLRAVKETPRIAAAVEIAPIIRNFRETSARNILVFTTVLTVLAATIAVGVVYNHARIALAERAWELASLRVLGMTRAEVSRLLLGEFALEIALALPLGWLAGYGLSAFIVEMIHSETFRIPLIILPRTYAYASLIVVAAGVASGLIVRRRVDRLDLVAVLKTRE